MIVYLSLKTLLDWGNKMFYIISMFHVYILYRIIIIIVLTIAIFFYDMYKFPQNYTYLTHLYS